MSDIPFRRPMKSLWRNLRGHLLRLLSPRELTLDGVRLCTAEAIVGRTVRRGIYKGTYEEPERVLLRGALRPGDRVLEVGAGIGFVSLVCARAVGAENVLSYEANPALQPLIRRHHGMNGLSPALRGRALTARGGDIRFFVNDNIVSSSLLARPGGREVVVSSDPIDAVLAEWRPTVIVMDVEGAEVDILTASDLPGVRRMVIELHPHVVDPGELARLEGHLARIGFVRSGTCRKSAAYSRD